LGRVKKSDKFKFEIIKVGEHGVYKARWFYGNADLKKSTFFPKEWTPSKVIEKILESLKNGESIDQGAGRFTVDGVTTEGVVIKTIVKMIKSDKGKLVSAYPVME